MPKQLPRVTIEIDGEMRFGIELEPAASVAHAFLVRLGKPLVDPQGTSKEIPINSPCGKSCLGAIDAAARVIAHAQVAGSITSEHVASLRALTAHTVSIYIYG